MVMERHTRRRWSRMEAGESDVVDRLFDLIDGGEVSLVEVVSETTRILLDEMNAEAFEEYLEELRAEAEYWDDVYHQYGEEGF